MRKAVPYTLLFAVGVSTIPGAVFATTTCNSSTACAAVTNTFSASASGGVAIHGAANSGIGVRGTSATNAGFYGASGSGAMQMPGVEGESTAAGHGFDAAGAFGLAAALTGAPPAYGVLGYGTTYGTYGEADASGASPSASGYGIFGSDASGSGNSFNVAVAGNSKVGTGVLGASNGTPTTGLIGFFPIGVYAVSDPAAAGSGEAVALEAQSSSTPIEARNTGNAATVQIDDQYDFFYGYNGTTGGDAEITTSGNETLSGTLTTSKGTYVATRGASGAMRTAYGERTTTPEMEDVGEAQLQNGRASVAIDSAFADSIDMRRPYYVFVTPEGNSNELYVTQKTPAGFVIREANGGRATIAVQYRIVAKPVDENDARLPAYHPTRAAHTYSVRQGTRMPSLASPEERLRQKLGVAGYARAIAALRARLAGR